MNDRWNGLPKAESPDPMSRLQSHSENVPWKCESVNQDTPWDIPESPPPSPKLQNRIGENSYQGPMREHWGYWNGNGGCGKEDSSSLMMVGPGRDAETKSVPEFSLRENTDDTPWHIPATPPASPKSHHEVEEKYQHCTPQKNWGTWDFDNELDKVWKDLMKGPEQSAEVCEDDVKSVPNFFVWGNTEDVTTGKQPSVGMQATGSLNHAFNTSGFSCATHVFKNNSESSGNVNPKVGQLEHASKTSSTRNVAWGERCVNQVTEWDVPASPPPSPKLQSKVRKESYQGPMRVHWGLWNIHSEYGEDDRPDSMMRTDRMDGGVADADYVNSTPDLCVWKNYQGAVFKNNVLQLSVKEPDNGTTNWV